VPDWGHITFEAGLAPCLKRYEGKEAKKPNYFRVNDTL